MAVYYYFFFSPRAFALRKIEGGKLKKKKLKIGEEREEEGGEGLGKQSGDGKQSRDGVGGCSRRGSRAPFLGCCDFWGGSRLSPLLLPSLPTPLRAFFSLGAPPRKANGAGQGM